MENSFLGEREREFWIWFHENSSREDVKLAEDLVLKYPRWSIIAGYYAMHDMAKLYLGKVHNQKVVGKDVHSRTVELLREHLSSSPERERVLGLLEEGKEEFDLARVSERTIPSLLFKGKEERGKAQYYSLNKDSEIFNTTFSIRASSFLEKIVHPFLKTMEKML